MSVRATPLPDNLNAIQSPSIAAFSLFFVMKCKIVVSAHRRDDTSCRFHPSTGAGFPLVSKRRHMSQTEPNSIEPDRTINVRGRTRAYLDRLRIRRRDYYLLERIGSPFRERYLAFDPLQGPGGDFALVQRWTRNAASDQYLRVLRQLKDDAFPRVYEWQPREGGFDVALTWVEGVSLSDYFEHVRAGRRPPVDPGQAVRLIQGLAHGMCRLHCKPQVAHGDLQPANVLLTSHPSRLVLIDFGSAWAMQAAAFRVDGDGHHRCYAAPELQGGGTADGFLADQFSISALLFQLLTQQLPFGGLGGKAGRPEYIAASADALVPPSRLSAVCANLPQSLRDGVDRVTMRGLALNPTQRYPDRHPWLDDLFSVSARFRISPELPPLESALTRVIQWFVSRTWRN